MPADGHHAEAPCIEKLAQLVGGAPVELEDIALRQSVPVELVGVVYRVMLQAVELREEVAQPCIPRARTAQDDDSHDPHPSSGDAQCVKTISP